VIQNKFSFEEQKLKIDFITLSTENLDHKKLARYLFDFFGFNCFLSQGNTRKLTETLFFNSKTKSTVIIRINYWNRIVIEFPGNSGQKLYQLLKSQRIDFGIFHRSYLRLTRLDLCYDQNKTEIFDSLKFDEFLIESRRQILDFTRTRHTKLLTRSNGRILLGINKRSNPRYLRVYETRTAIRFELELKNLVLEPFQACFFDYEFDFFESQLTQSYFRYAEPLFPLDNYFASWLLDFTRKYFRNQINNQFVLATEYFTDHRIWEHEKLYRLLQFLNFIKNLNNHDSGQYFLEGRKYFIQEFPLIDFMNFIGISSTKQNQRLKMIEYFRQLHKMDPIIETFLDGQFRLFATFLYSGVEKISNRWFVRIYIIEDLYDYNYPFVLSNSFRNYKNTTDCFLKTQLINTISVESTQKIFYLSQFLEQLKLSSKKIIKIKQDLIFLIKELVEQRIIQSNIKIIYKSINSQDLDLDRNKLNIKQLTKRVNYLLFYEKLDC
jgi:hypothetical protein